MAISKEIAEKFEEHHDRLRKVEVDMYFGDGKENPPVVTRLDRVERSSENISKLFWVLVVGIIAAIGDIVNTHLSHLK